MPPVSTFVNKIPTMKIVKILAEAIRVAYSPSITPNMFGSKKRKSQKEDISNDFKGYADDTQQEINKTESLNPFESAAAKSAMAKASRNARQMQTRNLNALGAGASPEALLASQENVNQAMGSAAGSIAAGADNTRNAQLNSLRNLQAGQRGTAAQYENAAADEIGKGWNTLFQTIGAIGGVASGVGQGLGAVGISKK